MGIPKTAYSPKGIVHFSVGAIIKKDDKYLLIDRASPPPGFSAIAGHIEAREKTEDALLREVNEESGLQVVGYKLLCEETLYGNICKRGVTNHHWFVFECEVAGEIIKNGESKSIGWYSKEEIKNLNLEPSWQHFFKKLEVI